ncbi:hypothetical protein GCM10023238_15220 [Streptomyces heliomycini]
MPFGGACETLEVRAGRALGRRRRPRPDMAEPGGVRLSALARPLGVDETRGVPVRVEPSGWGTPVTVEVGWPYGTSRDTAYFLLGPG